MAGTASHVLTVEDVLANYEITDATMSPDGVRAALVIQRPRTVGAERYGWDSMYGAERSDIWVVERGNGQAINITQGAADGSGSWRPVWSPDGQRLAMLSTKGGDNVRFYMWDVARRSLNRIHQRGAQLDAAIGEEGRPMAWVNPTQLICALLPAGERPETFAIGTPIRRRERNASWERTERGARPSVSVLEGGILVPEAIRPQGELALIHAVSGLSSVVMVGNIRNAVVAPSGKYVAAIVENGNELLFPDSLVSWPSDLSSGFHLHLNVRRRLAIVQLQTQQPPHWAVALLEPRFPSASGTWNSDGTAVLVLGKRHGFDPHVSAIFVGADGSVQWSVTGVVPPTEPIALSPLQTASHLRPLAVSERTGFALLVSEPDSGTFVLAIDSAGAPPAVRLVLNTHLASVKNDIGKDSLFSYRARNGSIYRARLWLPVRTSTAHRYPLIVKVYPGYVVPDTLPYHESAKPHSSQSAFLEMRLFAARGYVVLQPSIGQSYGEPMAGLAGYVTPAIDSLVRAGIVDSTKIGLLGHSHGALAAYGLLTTTRRFRAAAIINGPSDILHEYAGVVASNIESAFAGEWGPTGFLAFESTEFGGGLHIGATPWQSPDKWARNNPINHIDRVEAPLMLVHADNDVYDLSQATVAFQSLHRLGRRVRYVRYWGEAHTIESPANIRDLWARLYAWFKGYLCEARCEVM